MATTPSTASDTITPSQNQVNGNLAWDGLAGVDVFNVANGNVRNFFTTFKVTYQANGTAVFTSAAGGASGFKLTNFEKLTYLANGVSTTMDLAIYVTSVSPVATVPTNSDIVITFNETIKAGTGNAVIHSGTVGGTAVFTAAAASLIYSGNTLTIRPTSPLAANTHYFVTLDKGLVVSGAGTSTQHVFMGNLSSTNTTAANGYDFTTSAAIPTGVTVATFLLTPAVAQAIADSSANVAAKLDLLQTNLAKVTSISLTDASIPLTISAGQVTSDAGILAKLGTYSLAISDSSANIAANIDALQGALAKITSITQTGTPAALAITATQLANDAGALGLITGVYTLAVSGVTTTNLSSIIANTKVASVAITDTSANIAANLNALETNYLKIGTLTQSDSGVALTITATQLGADTHALAKLNNGAYTLNVTGVLAANAGTVLLDAHVASITVSDSSANIAANLNALETNYLKIGTLTQTNTGTALTISAAQLSADTHALAKLNNGTYTLNVTGVLAANAGTVLSNAHVASITVSDSSANIAANLNALETNYLKISTLTQSDSGAALSITAGQLSSDTHALAKLNNGTYTLNVTGVLAANVGTVLLNAHVASITVSDSSANIAANLNALETNYLKLSTLTQTDSGIALTITAAQLSADTHALAKLNGGTYTLNVTGVLAANAGTVLSDPHVSSISITDSSANLSLTANLDLLKTNLANISSFTFSDVAQISITSAQQTTYAEVLTKIAQTNPSYSLVLTDLATDIAHAIFTGAAVNILDTATNVSNSLDTLQANKLKINTVATSDALPITVTEAQITTDADILSKINGGNYTLNVSNVSSDPLSLASLLGNVHVTSLDVTDTPANISANLDALQANNSKIGTINIAYGSGPHTPISLTAAQIANDGDVIQKIVGLNNPLSVPFTVTGNTSSIGQNFTALNQYVNNISTIVRSDVKSILSITNDQFKNDTALLNKLGTKYSVSITDAVADKVTLDALLKTLHVVSANVVDTVSNISTNLDYLNTKVAKIGSIHLTDSNPIAITAKQFAADTKLLAKILPADNYSLDVSGVAAGGLVKLLTQTLKYVPHVHNVTIADSSLNIAKNLNTLQANIDKITSITQTGKAADLKVTALQVEQDKAALDKIGSYTLAVSDTSANVSIEIDKLQDQFTNNHFLPKTLIKLTDKAPVINVTAHQFEVDHDVLNQIAGKFNINIDADNGVLDTPTTSNFSANLHGAPSATHFDSVTGWSSGDTITYSNTSGNVLLTTVDTSVASLAKVGTALIDTSTAHVNFNAADNLTLAKQIAAVEKAFGLSTTHDAGQVAIWTNGNDTEILIRDAHTLKTAGAVGIGDELIKLVGVTADHVVLDAGVIHYI
ncbi:MAG: Ig-like domain-containing protein [Methylococcales bacterium]|nr:Ig-like domain-containing protein [Methylococcales bacterium]